MDRPRTRVTNFLLARDRIVDEHDCDIHPKKEVASWMASLPPSCSPSSEPALRAGHLRSALLSRTSVHSRCC